MCLEGEKKKNLLFLSAAFHTNLKATESAGNRLSTTVILVCQVTVWEEKLCRVAGTHLSTAEESLFL